MGSSLSSSMISIHALLAESDAASNKAGAESFKFLSTLSLRRATRGRGWIQRHRDNFYPRSPCGERPFDTVSGTCRSSFLSTLSLRRATIQPHQGPGQPPISIHALLAESDAAKIKYCCNTRDFYPRSPCGERHHGHGLQKEVLTISIHALLAESDTRGKIHDPGQILFLSTLSLRRATLPAFSYSRPLTYFYPRSPCGERLVQRV